MQSLRYLFLERDWANDCSRIQDVIASLGRDGRASLFLFPEGSDLSEENKTRSKRFAQKRGLAEYEHVLHPRTRGFTAIWSKMRKALDARAVWDMTIGYVGFQGGAGEGEFLAGQWPREVHVHINRFAASSLPTGDHELETWLNTRWAAKEGALAEFYHLEAEGKRPVLPGADPATARPSPFPWVQLVSSGAPLFILVNTVALPYLLWTYYQARWLWILGALQYIMAPFAVGGLDQLLCRRT